MITRALRSLLLLVCSVALLSTASGVQADAQSKQASKKILYVTHSAGFKHAVLPHSEQVFP